MWHISNQPGSSAEANWNERTHYKERRTDRLKLNIDSTKEEEMETKKFFTKYGQFVRCVFNVYHCSWTLFSTVPLFIQEVLFVLLYLHNIESDSAKWRGNILFHTPACLHIQSESFILNGIYSSTWQTMKHLHPKKREKDTRFSWKTPSQKPNP